MQSRPIDIIALNETRLDSSIPDIDMEIDGYDLVRNARKRGGGGVAMYLTLNSGFSYKICKVLMPSDLEIIVIEIKISKAKSFILIAWYRTPDSGIKLFDNIELILEQVEQEDKEMYLIGDINCDLLTERPTCYTVKMKEVAVQFNLTQLITEATRVTETSSTLIDHIYTSCPHNISKSGVIKSGIASDHYIVYALLGKEKKAVKHSHKYSVSRKYKHFDVNVFTV